VIGCCNYNDYGDVKQKERFECGHQLVYRLRFEDGFEWDAFEDELLDSKADCERPDPPTGPTNFWMCAWDKGSKPKPEWLDVWLEVYGTRKKQRRVRAGRPIGRGPYGADTD